MTALPTHSAAGADPSASDARTTIDVRCDHCALPVPAGMVRAGSARQFCCTACETVWGAIHDAGLERYYDYRAGDAERDRPDARPARQTRATYDEYDDPTFERLHCAVVTEGAGDAPSGLRRVTLHAEGMHCAACVWLLERLPRVAPGVVESRADLGRGHVTIVWDIGRTRLSVIARAVARLGYPTHPVRDRSTREARLREDRAALARIGVAGAIFGNTMLLAVCLYAGIFTGIEREHGVFLRVASAALGTLAVCWPGAVFFRGALASIRVRTLHMDVPIALALAVGLAHGIINTARGAGEVYFDTLATLVFLLLIGRWVQHGRQRAASDAVEALYALTPCSARIIDASGSRETPVEALKPGDIVEVGAGESVPVDGVVSAGESSVNNALLTGESTPATVAPGDVVAAGSVNLSSVIRVAVRATGRETRLGRLMTLVEEQARRRAPIVRMADRLTVWFVAVVLACAAAVAAAWWRTDPARAVEHAVALLIVTCPCALGLATPLAVMVGIGRAARRGILIKGGATLEALSRPGVIIFDKTGTLTTGDLRLIEFIGPAPLRRLVAAAEEGCRHPVARALRDGLADPLGAEPAPVAISRQTLGGGVEAEAAGVRLVIGSTRFVLGRIGDRRIPDHLASAIDRAASAGQSPVLVAADGEPCAVAIIGDAPRPDAADSIRRLRRAGWSPVLLSGDDPRVARAVGTALGLAEREITGGASPEDKASIVRERVRHGTVVMVGDGVNDAAALAAATAGIAVHGGAEAALAAADASLVRPGLAPLIELIDGSRLTTSVIRRNLGVSLGYNVVFAALAAAGLVNPLVAAIIMPISSITVVMLSFRTAAFAGNEQARWD